MKDVTSELRTYHAANRFYKGGLDKYELELIELLKSHNTTLQQTIEYATNLYKNNILPPTNIKLTNKKTLMILDSWILSPEYRNKAKELRDNAMEQIVYEYTRISKFIVGKFIRSLKRYLNITIKIGDFHSVALYGLCKAIDRHSYLWPIQYLYGGIKFCILRYCHNEIETQYELPNNSYPKLIKYQKFTTKYYNKHGYYPSDEEIYKELNINKSSKNILQLFYKIIGDPKQLKQDLSCTKKDDIDIDAQTLLISKLQLLDDRQRTIIVDRYGLETGEMTTLEHIAKKLGYTRERIRQIESKALAKLQQPFFDLHEACIVRHIISRPFKTFTGQGLIDVLANDCKLIEEKEYIKSLLHKLLYNKLITRVIKNKDVYAKTTMLEESWKKYLIHNKDVETLILEIEN